MQKLLLVAAVCAALACKREAPGEQPQLPVRMPVEAHPPPPQQVQEQEPNDFQHAQAIPSRAVVAGSIAPLKARAADDDWYRLEPKRTMALRIDLRQVGDAPLDAWLELYDRDRNRLLRVHAGGEDKGTIPAAACVEACFVKVSGTSPAKYELTVLGDDPLPGQELEPNNRAVDATALQAGMPMRGTYLSSDDEDWYRLELPQPVPGLFLRVEVTPVDGVRPELEVRALSDGALLAELRAGAAGGGLFVRDLSLHLGEAHPVPDAGVAENSNPNPNQIPDRDRDPDRARDAGSADAGLLGAGATTAPPIDAGSAEVATATHAGAADASVAAPPPAGYYLVLKSGWYAGAKGKSVRGAAPLAPYTLTASLEAGPPDLEQEPNDDPQHATPAQTTATGYLAPAGDQDWYRIHADAPSVLHVELSGIERADLELAVYAPPAKPGEKPVLLARANEGGVKEGEVLPAVGVPAGDSWVQVQAAARDLDGKRVRDGEDRKNAYKLAFVLSPDDGSTEREPNNDVASAQTLRVPATVKGWIWPRKDVDVFRFHVGESHAPVSINLSAVRGVDLQLRLLEVRGSTAQVIGSSDSVRGEGEEKLLSVPLKEGDYAAEVSSPRNKDASATQSYTLTIQ